MQADAASPNEAVTKIDKPVIGGVPAELAEHTGFLLSKLGLATSQRFAAAMEPLGLDPRQFAVITVLGAHDGIAQQELADRLRIHPSSMVAVIDECEAAGLLERRRDPADRRRYAIHLSTTGRTLRTRAGAVAKAFRDEIFSELDGAEQKELHGLLLRLATAGPLSGLGAHSPPSGSH